MANYSDLKALIDSEPLNAAKTDQLVADWCNEAAVVRNISALDGNVLFRATNGTEFAALTDTKKQLWVAFTSGGQIDPFDAANVSFVQWIFGAGSTTVGNLSGKRTETITRAASIGWPALVQASDVIEARAT